MTLNIVKMIEISIWIAILRHKYMKFPSLFTVSQNFSWYGL